MFFLSTRDQEPPRPKITRIFLPAPKMIPAKKGKKRTKKQGNHGKEKNKEIHNTKQGKEGDEVALEPLIVAHSLGDGTEIRFGPCPFVGGSQEC